jgi:hypothetical protein
MAQARPQAEKVPCREDLRLRIESRIRQLERASGTGLWSMVLFILVSFAAFNNFSFLPDLSEESRRMLGRPPPPDLISLALLIYAFAGIIRTLTRMSQNIKPLRGFVHTLFFIAFYTFYHLSGALPDNFWAVFFAGIGVMGLDNYYLWTHSKEAVEKEKQVLNSMQKE